MTRTHLGPRRMAELVTILVAALFIVPLASAVVTARWQAWRLRAHDGYLTSAALIAMAEAQNPQEGTKMFHMPPLALPGCDVQAEQLPYWTEGEDRFWATWGPRDAVVRLQAILSIHNDRLNGPSALRARYIDDHTSDFERRFLIGCVSGTLFAPICMARANDLMRAADNAPIPSDLRQRDIDLEEWKQKALCAFAKGILEAKPSKAVQNKE